MPHPAAKTSSRPIELFSDEFHRGPAYETRRPHGSGDWLLIYTQAGAGRFLTARGACETHAGHAILYAPHDLHHYRTSPGAGHWHLLWVHFLPQAHWQPWLKWQLSPAGLRLLTLEPGEVRTNFAAALRRMIGLSRRELPGALDLASNALEEALLWAGVAASQDTWMTMDIRVRKAIDYLTASGQEPFALEKLARHSGVSVSRLAFLFKRETGSTPRQFLERHRMQRASQLLRLTGLNIAEVAAQIGYADPFYFSNRFRRFAGQTPSAYRQSHMRGA